MGKISLDTTQQQSAPGAWQAIALSDEGSDRFSFSHPMGNAIIYQLHLEAEGIPESLAEVWGQGVANRGSDSPGDRLMHGLYCYFVGGSHG